MRVDVNAFLGAYPYRKVPGTSPDALLQAMDRVAIDEAWISHLPSLFWRAPGDGNAWLFETAARQRRFKPVPAVHPGLGDWEETLGEAADRGALRSGVLRVGPGGPRDARARRGVRRRAAAPHDGRAPRGLASAPSQRSRGGAPRRRAAHADPERRGRAAGDHPRGPPLHRGGAFRLDAGGGGADLVGHQLDLGAAGGSLGDRAGDDR